MKKVSRYFSFVLPVLLIVAFVFSSTEKTLAEDTGFLTPSANSNSGWDAPQNAYASDNSRTHSSSGDDLVQYYNFNFPTIPAGATINGIEVRVEGYTSTTNHIDRQANLSLSWNNGTNYTSGGSGIKQTNVPESNNPNNETTSTYGSPSDTWGRAWTTTDFTNANFRLKLDTITASQGTQLRINMVAVKVTYTPIVKTNPTLSVTNSPVAYTGSAQSATVVGSVAGVVSDVKYDGSSTAPTNSGTYAVTADFVPTDTTNYNNLSDASAGNFVIEAAPTPTTGSIQITKYACPEGTTVTRSVNGVGGTVPDECELQGGKTFGYVHGEQSDANAPYPELSAPITPAGSTNENGILTIDELPATGRYLIVETDEENQQLPADEVLGLYCVGDGDTSDNNDNQELTFVTADTTVQCVAYNEVPVVTPPGPEFVTVTIVKYIEGDGYIAATTENTDSATFPMTSTWSAENIGAGSGDFSLGPTGFNNPNPYQATTSNMTSGADYSVVENLDSTCTAENDGEYVLVGYKIGNSIEGALESDIQEVASIENITSDKFIIVINEKCNYVTPPPVCEANEAQVYVSDTSNGDTEVTPHQAWTSISGATWIWSAPFDLEEGTSASVGTETFTKEFTITGNPLDSTLEIAADNTYTVTVNEQTLDTGTSGDDSDNFSSADTWTIPAELLSTGTNVITIEVNNQEKPEGYTGPNPAGVIFKITVNSETCPIIEDDDDDEETGPTTGTLIIKKVVINNDGGNASANDFSFTVTAGDSITPPMSFIEDDENPLLGQNTLGEKSPDTYTVTESPSSEYTTSYDNCENIVLTAGETETCTITNDDNDSPTSRTISSGSVRRGSVLGASTGGQVLGEETSCGLTLELGKFMKKGYAGNDSAQVSILQQFLKDYLGLPNLIVNGIFGDDTEAAVKQFQAMPPHNEKILKPWGLTKPTGIVYITTIIEINNVKCVDLKIPIPATLVPFKEE